MGSYPPGQRVMALVRWEMPEQLQPKGTGTGQSCHQGGEQCWQLAVWGGIVPSAALHPTLAAPSHPNVPIQCLFIITSPGSGSYKEVTAEPHGTAPCCPLSHTVCAESVGLTPLFSSHPTVCLLCYQLLHCLVSISPFMTDLMS